MEKKMSRSEENEALLKQGKDISELECIYSLEDLKTKVKEMYPEMHTLEVNYHAEHLLDLDWLKVCDVEAELETSVKEQVEELNV